MPSIDERVVSMAFENAVFEQRVAVTMSTLSKLNTAISTIGQKSGLSNIETDANKVRLLAPMSALDKLKAKLGNTHSGTTFTDMERASNKVTLEQPNRALDNLKNKLDRTNAGTTFTDMENAGNRVDFRGLSNAIDGIKGHLTGLQTAAAVAFGNIASQAAMKGASFAKSFSFGPIKQGFQEYQTNLQSIQTILSNTADSGGNLRTVNAALDELNDYSDKTIYNFSEMARNIGTFTAAGVKLGPATQSIKGIANLAALSGSNSQQASTAMYQLSQAIAAGKVGLQDWNSVVNAGMGGAVFQKSLMRTAENMGTIEKGAIKIDKATGKATINGESFRESISAKPGEKSWLTSEVLTNTLGQLTGDMTNAELAAKGFTASQIKAIQAQAKTAQDAATQVKTLPQVFDVAKETIGSGWSATFRTIFGNFTEAKTTFTELSQAINGFINTNADARNKVLNDWKALGGRVLLIEGIKLVFHDLMAVLKTVKDAFREVFPPKTGKDLFRMTQAFIDFGVALNPSKQTLENLKRTFAGVFAVAHIGWTIIKNLGMVIFDLLGVVGKGSGGFLNFTGGIGDFLVSVDKAISKGNALGGFFKGLTNILRIPIELIKSVASALFGLFGGGDEQKWTDQMAQLQQFGKVLTPIERITLRVKDAWKKLGDVFATVKDIISPWIDQVIQSFSGLGTMAADAIKNMDFDKVLLAFQTTFLGGIFLTLKKALGGGGGFDFGGGLLKNLKNTLEGLTGTLAAMQKQVQATTLLTIAAAIVALALGVKLLSTIDPKKMATAMTAVAVGLGELGAALAIMSSKLGKSSIFLMPIIAASMVGLAVAVTILAGAMKIFATMKWEELARGLAGVAGSIAAVGIGIKLINPATLIPTAAGLLAIGVALNLIAVAAKIFSEMKWEELAKGLLGIGGGLFAISAGVMLMGPSLLLVGPGLIAASIGVTLLAGAVSAFSALSPKKMLSGILGLGLAISALAIAVMLIPPTIGLQAAGLVIMGAALASLAAGLAAFGSMKVGTLAKGIISMALALGILAVNMALFVGSAAGSASFLLAAAGIAIFVPALALMGNLPWSVILKGIGGLALSLGVIAVVGLVAAPALLALGAALGALGLGLVLIGTAIYIAAKGLALLGENGAKGIGVLVSAITAFIAVFPSLVINFVKGMVSIAEEVAKVAPKVVMAFGVIIDTVIAFIIEQAPKMALAINALLAAILNVLATNAQPLITAGWRLIQSLLTGISSNIGSVVSKVGEIITRFLNSFATQAPRIVQAGARLLAAYLNGIANNLGTVIAAAARVVNKFLAGVTAQLPGVIRRGATLIVTFLQGISSNIGRIQAAGVNIIVKYIDGIGKAIPRIIDAGVRVVRRFLNGIAQAIPALVDAGFKAVIKFLNGIARAIRQNDDQLLDAGANIANALGEGLMKGLNRIGPWIKDKVGDIIKALPRKALSILGIHSPSKVFQDIGEQTMLGMALGLANGSTDVNRTMDKSANSVVDTAAGTFGKVPGILDGMMDMRPVITPVLDLSSVQQEARKLDGLTNVTPITAAASYDQAAAISREKASLEAFRADRELKKEVPSVTFEQNNYSPEPLSPIELYRQTHNQLSHAKRALGLQDPGLMGLRSV